MVEGDGTPLIVAARKGDLETVRLLVARGADVNVAARGDGNPLIMAAMAGHLPVVRYLVEQGAQVEAMVEGDENPLINAAGHGHLEVVRFLVERGANVNAGVWVNNTVQVGQTYQTVPEYRSPLSMATKGGHRAVIDFLRAKGAVN
jgi:ankyrin repeat protein